MEELRLNEAQSERKKYILKCIASEMTTLEAALTTGLTQRRVQQQINEYKDKGDAAFIHGNTGKKHDDSYYIERKQKVINIFLYTRIDGKNPFENISYAYFTEILNEEFGIKCSKTWVKRVLKSIGYKLRTNTAQKRKSRTSFPTAQRAYRRACASGRHALRLVRGRASVLHSGLRR